MYFAYQVSDLQVVKGYDINARFLKVGGLNVGSDVRINGIKVGTVIAQNLDPEDYVADVKLSISSNIQLPKDSVVSVVSDAWSAISLLRLNRASQKNFCKTAIPLPIRKTLKRLRIWSAKLSLW